MKQDTKRLQIPSDIEIPDSILNLVEKILSTLQPDQIVLFGSRARKTHRPNSDFDIAVKAKSLNGTKWKSLLLTIEEEPVTLFSVDLVHYEEMDETYKHNIDREGVVLYG